MTNLVLLSIQLVTNDVSINSGILTAFPDTNGHRWTFKTNWIQQKKEVWQLYTIGYKPPNIIETPGDMVYERYQAPVPMLTLSNMIGTLEPKQETNWVFTPSK